MQVRTVKPVVLQLSRRWRTPLSTFFNPSVLSPLTSRSGSADVAEWLLKQKAGRLDLVREGRDNPLHAAVRSGRSQIVEVLLAAGARIDARDSK